MLLTMIDFIFLVDESYSIYICTISSLSINLGCFHSLVTVYNVAISLLLFSSLVSYNFDVVWGGFKYTFTYAAMLTRSIYYFLN